MNVDIFHCGLITSFIYTVIYVAKNFTIIEYNYIKNISFQSDICGIFDVVFLQYPISFIAVFQGPAPLLSCRTSLIFIQGMYESLKIPTVLLSGNNFYKYNFFDIVIIQNFCGNYVLIEKKKK